jgi:ABC-type multidrug transport system ATPase subunit
MPIKNLSTDNKQVGVAQELMHRSELLLLRESTAGLDPLIQEEVYHLLYEAQATGATVFCSSHIVGEVEISAELGMAGRPAVCVVSICPVGLVAVSPTRYSCW